MQNDTSTTTGSRRELIDSIATLYGIEPHELTPDVIYTLGQIEYAKRIAISEGCGSGELPDRLRARAEEREAELRRLLDEQGQQDHQPAALESSARTLFERHQRALESVPIQEVIDFLQQQTDARVYAEAASRDAWGNESDGYIIQQSFTAKGLRYFAALARLEDALVPEEIEPGDDTIETPAVHDLLALLTTGPVPVSVDLVQRVTPEATQDQLDAARAALLRAIEVGGYWANWEACQEALDAAYSALGFQHRDHAAAFQSGRHPIQASRFWQINRAA